MRNGHAKVRREEKPAELPRFGERGLAALDFLLESCPWMPDEHVDGLRELRSWLDGVRR